MLCANSHGIMIMYSVQDESSFESVKYWMDEVKRVGRSGVKVVLVGNKSDEHEKKVVSYARAREFADKHDKPLFEVSAKDGTNVELAVLTELAFIHYHRPLRDVASGWVLGTSIKSHMCDNWPLRFQHTGFHNDTHPTSSDSEVL